MEEKDIVDKMTVYDVVSTADAAKKQCRVVRTHWVLATKGSNDQPQLRVRWVAHEFRGRRGHRHQYFCETPDRSLVKAVIAHAARCANQSDTVAAVFDVRRVYFDAEENRDTFVESPAHVPADVRVSHVRKLRKVPK